MKDYFFCFFLSATIIFSGCKVNTVVTSSNTGTPSNTLTTAATQTAEEQEGSRIVSWLAQFVPALEDSLGSNSGTLTIDDVAAALTQVQTKNFYPGLTYHADSATSFYCSLGTLIPGKLSHCYGTLTADHKISWLSISVGSIYLSRAFFRNPDGSAWSKGSLAAWNKLDFMEAIINSSQIQAAFAAYAQTQWATWFADTTDRAFTDNEAAGLNQIAQNSIGSVLNRLSIPYDQISVLQQYIADHPYSNIQPSAANASIIIGVTGFGDLEFMLHQVDSTTITPQGYTVAVSDKDLFVVKAILNSLGGPQCMSYFAMNQCK